MSHEMSGSEKLKAQCQTMTSLTPEEISQIAGGLYSVNSFNLSTIPSWLIRGIPVDIYHINSTSISNGF